MSSSGSQAVARGVVSALAANTLLNAAQLPPQSPVLIEQNNEAAAGDGLRASNRPANVQTASSSTSSQISISARPEPAPLQQHQSDRRSSGNFNINLVPLAEFLERIGLAQYHEALTAEGFDSIARLADITEEDFTALNVKRGHRRVCSFRVCFVI